MNATRYDAVAFKSISIERGLVADDLWLAPKMRTSLSAEHYRWRACSKHQADQQPAQFHRHGSEIDSGYNAFQTRAEAIFALCRCTNCTAGRTNAVHVSISHRVGKRCQRLVPRSSLLHSRHRFEIAPVAFLCDRQLRGRLWGLANDDALPTKISRLKYSTPFRTDLNDGSTPHLLLQLQQ
jgi:hypothetical protein